MARKIYQEIINEFKLEKRDLANKLLKDIEEFESRWGVKVSSISTLSTDDGFSDPLDRKYFIINTNIDKDEWNS